MANDSQSILPQGTSRSEAAKRVIKEHPWAAIGLLIGVGFPAFDRLVEKELTVGSMLALFIGTLFFLVDVARESNSSTKTISEKIDHLTTDKLNEFEAAVDNNTRALRAHEHLLASRTTDRLTLIGFKNLLAYLPFYLAEDLGYLQEEHIEITSFLPSLDDQSTASLLLKNSKNGVAMCDPYMCLANSSLRMVYPLCNRVSAWPMTLNWIGSADAASRKSNKVQVAAYKAPSTTHVLAQLVARRLVSPRLSRSSKLSATVVELNDSEAQFGESEVRKDVEDGLQLLLMQYDVIMLWEPHCEIALQLGARYFFPNEYEAILKDFGPSVMYSGVLLTQEMIHENPTLPIRLRRALDRAVARLQDPNRYSYCRQTLEQRRLLAGFERGVCESVLARLVENTPPPADTADYKRPGWNTAGQTWAAEIFAAHSLRKSLVFSQPDLATRLQYQVGATSDDCRQLIYSHSVLGD